ncbi:hypothetical protein SAMN05192534_10749 [Alteribacillus persepolensis]|uniref:Uncharacterized protein n=1 Tax=Alteribacillus persepolensis TaxID=568899 RepID=A0A1G8DDW1_9BACI|nr:hypothetical protein [Alteribacillus persepolensis]SDH55629.1 hypothetical protein SAMN05192534_10749 [Alteribacillus persepolensis]
MNNSMHMYHLCQQHVGQFVAVQTKNNEWFNGYMENVDEENVYLMIPEYDHNTMGVMGAQTNNANMHQYSPQQPYHDPQHNMPAMRPGVKNGACGCQRDQRQYYPPYGPYYYPYPRYRRLILPLAALVALSALPFY